MEPTLDLQFSMEIGIHYMAVDEPRWQFRLMGKREINL
jgi:hypothetical protein